MYPYGLILIFLWPNVMYLVTSCVFRQKLLCAYAFPSCVVKEKGAIPLPLCYEECVAVREVFCYSDWALIESNKNRRVYIKSKGHFTLPNCDELPKYNNNQTPTCSWTKIIEKKKDEVTSENLFFSFCMIIISSN